MKNLDIQANIHNLKSSNIPKDLNELLREYKRKKTCNNVSISNLPKKKPKNILEDFTSEKINKNIFVKKYNDIMSEISSDYILVQPKVKPNLENKKLLKNLSLNNFIKDQIQKDSPLKNIKREILNTNIEDMNFDNFYMDSRNINSIAKVSGTNSLLKNLKKNELLNSLQNNCNGINYVNDNSKNNYLNYNLIQKHNGNYINNTRSISIVNPNIFRLKKENFKDDELENTNSTILNNLNSIKNEFSKITNIANFSNYNKSYIKKNSTISKDEIDESMKNSTGKTFYNSITRTPNSIINGNNNECYLSNLSKYSVSPQRKNQNREYNVKDYKSKTTSNFYIDKDIYNSKNSFEKNKNQNMNDNSIITNRNEENISNRECRDKKTNIFVEKYKNLNYNNLDLLSDKISFDKSSIQTRKKENCSIDVSINNISNFNSIDNTNKNDMINYNSENIYNYNKIKNESIDNSCDLNFNKYKNYKKLNNLNILNSSVPPLITINKKSGSESPKKRNVIFTKIDSLYSSLNSFYNNSDIKTKNKLSEKYFKIGKSMIKQYENSNRNSFSLSKFNNNKKTFYKNDDKLLDNETGIIFDSNFDTKKIGRELIKKSKNFDLIKDQPCKYNKFNNFRHLRQEIEKSELTLQRNNNNNNNLSILNKNLNKLNFSNNDNDFTFSKTTGTFITKSNILNKIEATKRLKLK